MEYFLEYPNELEKYFPYTIVSHFSKESMSLLFRAGDFFNYDRFFQANDYFLEVIAEMCNYMVDKTGHSAEFLDCLLPAFDLDSKAMKKMMKVFEEYSDKYFVEGLENGFENDDVVGSDAFKYLGLFVAAENGEIDVERAGLFKEEMFPDGFNFPIFT